MTEKICLCSAMEAGEFDNEYRGSAHRPKAINWMKNSDGSYETSLLEDEEINAKVRCQCGEYMETHLVGKYHKRMIAVCSCDKPKPKIMECDPMTEELPFCECGCGEEVTKLENRFIHGHNQRGKHHTPEACSKMSVIRKGVSKSPETCAAMSKAKTGVPLSPEHIAAIKEGQEEAGVYDIMTGGNDLVTHHYIYDNSDLSLNTVQMTRSDHMQLHRLLQKLKYIVPHINIKEI